MSASGPELLRVRPADGIRVLRIECSWCKDVLREGDPGAETSHGICDPCANRMRARQAAQRVVVSGRQR